MPHQPAVTLTADERTTLESFVHRGKANARTITRARILLKSADGWSTAELAAAFDVCEQTVTNVRGRFARGGVEAVLHDKVQQHRRSALLRLTDGSINCNQILVGTEFGTYCLTTPPLTPAFSVLTLDEKCQARLKNQRLQVPGSTNSVSTYLVGQTAFSIYLFHRISELA